MSGSHENRGILIIAGLIIGAIAGFLVLAGNPGNIGFCIGACFIRDTILWSRVCIVPHRYSTFTLNYRSYIRGLCIVHDSWLEHQQVVHPPIIRFILGFFVMIVALMFLGCPLVWIFASWRRWI